MFGQMERHTLGDGKTNKNGNSNIDWGHFDDQFHKCVFIYINYVMNVFL